ncbi:DUF4198 domain-containing protein [Hymenobacter crusticola]|uniref:DUF4198 domain-containing protein n=1 Tax=Hymenobacter crusticola TaxID=1770526 RepID=A0A243WES8_9BACT|nr:DUF4198 domain-containing protein [Hymenobacter crusticola]OUJ73990.1 hypothetical protein BXP70_09545 [Hymenobacter crusticola]
MRASLKFSWLLLFCGIAAARAQEFWLAPRFFLPLHGRILVPMLAGNNFTGVRWRGKNSRLTRYVHYAPSDSTNLLPLVTQHDTSLATVTLAQPGTHQLALATNNAFLTFAADSFNAYLRAERLDNILLIRKQREQLAQPAREAYRRCAKALVQVGTGSSPGSTFNRVAGLPLELIPEQDPYGLRVGASLTVRLLADGQPVAGALLKVWCRDVKKNVEKIEIRTNQNGRALFRLSTPGTYLISTMRMTPSANPQVADWQSTWSSLTFGFASRTSR